MRSYLALALMVSMLVVVAAAASPAAGPSKQRGSERGDEIELLEELMGLEPGKVGADIGAGGGQYSERLYPRVLPGGHWYANEVSQNGLRRMRERFGSEESITVVEGSDQSTGLPDRCCDAAMLRVVYHHLRNPEAMALDFVRLLKPGGRLVIVENDPQGGENADGVPDNRSGMGIDRQIVIDELTGAGFTMERLVEGVALDYAILFRAPSR